jgi:MFS family permease
VTAPAGTDAAFAAKWRSVGILSLCAVLVLALWFSASAVIPAWRAAYGLSDLQAALLTSSVSVGFVAGTLASAILGLADRLDARRFFMISALVGAAVNAGLLVVDPTGSAAPVMRFVVGATMAGVYPVGMKLIATWARGDTGLLVGLLVGALTLGSASPHLLDAFGGLDWRFTIAAASVLAAAGALLINLVPDGPNAQAASPFRPALVLRAWTNVPLRLANLGYLGHMWELYAMWAWIGLFFAASFAANPGGEEAALLARFATFAVIGAGVLGCLFGGLFADRLGRTTLTMGAMVVSGACALSVGFLFGAAPWLLIVVGVIWGIAVVADSAQFSASVIELADEGIVGTMLTIQTSLGFLLTVLTIHLIPPLVDALGWGPAFAVLAAGPFLGVIAMGRLRARPEAHRLANGNR